MYADPTKIRSHIVKVRLSDEEHRLIEAIVAYTGEQKAALVRELALSQALSILDPQPSAEGQSVEGRISTIVGR